jgi:hypothetical protein
MEREEMEERNGGNGGQREMEREMGSECNSDDVHG